MSDHSSDRTDRGPADKFAGMDMSSGAKSPELAPEQELSAPPPDDIEPVAPKMEALLTEPKLEAEAPKAEAPLIEPKLEAEAPKVEAASIEPKLEAEAPKAEASAIESGIEVKPSKAEATRIEPNVEAEAPRADASRETGKIMIVPPSRDTSWDDKSWDRATIDRGSAARGAQASGRFGRRRLGAIAAIAVLAAITGALATSGLRYGAANEKSSSSAMVSHTQALEATIKQLESEVATLKTSIDRSAKGDAGLFAKVNDRLDKIEKAHSESAAKLARLHETLDKQHAAVAPAAPVTAATNVTGSIPTAATTAVPLPAPKPAVAVAHLPAVEGWILRDITNGGALIEGRGGLYEVYAGDPVPGLGRVDAIRKQDGRWVVVTSRGLIVAR